MDQTTRGWAARARRAGGESLGQRWQRLGDLARRDTADQHPDPFTVAERWLGLIAPRLEEHRAATRGRRYALLKDIAPALQRDPLEVAAVEEAMSELPTARPLHDRVSVCILGVPSGAI
jgi:hypothetical protein